MASIVLNKTVSLNAPITVESLHGVVFSNESNGHKFVISCMRGGELLTLTGTVTARFMRSNNTTILIAGNDYTGIVDGKAFVSLPQDCYNVPGRFQMAIFLSDSGTTNCIYACVGSVQRTQEGTLIDSGEAVPSLDQLLAKIADCEQATEAATLAATKSVRYDDTQALTGSEKAQARINIDALNVTSIKDLFVTKNKTSVSVIFNQGTYSITSGGTVASSNAVRTHSVLPDDIIGVKVPDGMRCRVYAFDNNIYIGRYTNIGFSKSAADTVVNKEFSDFLFTDLSSDKYKYKLVISYIDGADIIPTDVQNVILFYYVTDDTLTISGKIADARIVGEAVDAVDTKAEAAGAGVVMLPIDSVVTKKFVAWNGLVVTNGADTQYMTDYIPLPFDDCTVSFDASSGNTQSACTFYDDEKNVISGVRGKWATSNTDFAYDVSVPSGSKYIIVSGSTSGMAVVSSITFKSAMRNLASNIVAIEGENETPTNVIVSPEMTRSAFISDFDTALRGAYTALCLCDSHSFKGLNGATSYDEIYSRINNMFRDNVYVPGITMTELCRRINVAFAKPIRRFCDAKSPSGSCDFSLPIGNTLPEFDATAEYVIGDMVDYNGIGYVFKALHQAGEWTGNDVSVIMSGEPSLYVSLDGGTLYVYGYNRRWHTYDGIKWYGPENIVLSDSGAFGHAGFSVIEDTIFMVARDYRNNNDLIMYTSPITDGLNFTYRGVVLPMGHDFGDGLHIDNWGNSYILKDAETYYLFIEGRQNVDGNFWDIYLVTCTNPFVENSNGTIGNWQNVDVAPILVGAEIFPTSSNAVACGNPDIAKGSDNRPVKVDGKWYMYFHSTAFSYSYILRAYSSDLIHWTFENQLFDNRQRPTEGQNQSSNADHAIIEFKSRTYLFYTIDINTQLAPKLRYMIDDRPIREMLRLIP